MDKKTFVLVLLSVAFYQVTSALNVKVSKLPRTLRQAPDEEQTIVVHDNHTYYTSSYYPPGQVPDGLWIDFDPLIDSGADIVTFLNITDYYEVVPLAFDFPIYGHTIDAVGVAIPGFLYTGTIYHDFVHLTQYIAALQANFDPSISPDSRILMLNTDKRFTVQWDNLYNVHHVDAGPFTFQISLLPTGEIHFVYDQVPLPVSELNATAFPVEVGIADALYLSQYEFDNDGALVLVVYIYEYHDVTLNATDNLTDSAYVLKPLPNCVIAKTCDECLDLSATTEFDCYWCEASKQCSDGIDRNYRDWLIAGCFDTATQDCSYTPVPTEPTRPTETEANNAPLSQGAVVGVSVSAALVVLLLAAIIVVAAVFTYAYCKPNSRVGLYMIEHRPKARYLNREPKVSSDGEKVNF